MPIERVSNTTADAGKSTPAASAAVVTTVSSFPFQNFVSISLLSLKGRPE